MTTVWAKTASNEAFGRQAIEVSHSEERFITLVTSQIRLDNLRASTSMPTNALVRLPSQPTVIEPGRSHVQHPHPRRSMEGRRPLFTCRALAISARKAGLPCWVYTSADA